MNCQRFELVVSELARGQMMEADVRGEALAHADSCDDCAARLRDEETLTRGLQSLASDMASLNAPDEIELKLRQAFRVTTPLSQRRNSRYRVAAIAAVLLIAIGVTALRSRTDEPYEMSVDGPEPPRITTQEPKPEVKETPKKEEVAVKPRRRAVRRPANSQVANHVTREIATEFMPLGYLNAATLQDGGQIVRVELPRSALVNFGLPVNMDRYNEKVKADVLLGVDGLAHAIRFVQ